MALVENVKINEVKCQKSSAALYRYQGGIYIVNEYSPNKLATLIDDSGIWSSCVSGERVIYDGKRLEIGTTLTITQV